MEEDRGLSNIIVFYKDQFNSLEIGTIQMNLIVLRPLTTHELKKIWETQMGIIIDEKTRAQLKIIRRQLHRKIQGCLKTFKKTWNLPRNRAFHKFSINSSRLRICSNLSHFSIIQAVESLVQTNNILRVTSKTIWSTKSNLMLNNNNGSLKEDLVVNSSFIHKVQILATVPTMRKTLFNKTKGCHIHTSLTNSIKDRDLFHSLNHREICSIAIFLQLNSGQDPL
jgi:hypothetical protein